MSLRPLRKAERKPLRVCPICGQEYRPRFARQRTDGGRCARILVGRKLRARGQPIGFARAIVQKKAAAKARVEALCLKQWGELSVREIEIFNFAAKVGYTRGYNRCMVRRARQRPEAA